MKKRISRRYFLMGSAAAVATLGSRRRIPRISANDKLNIAAIGAGGQARTDIHRCKEENIVAMCDVDQRRAARTFSEFPDAAKYTDFRVMLEKEKDIDAVIITVPDQMHAVAAMHAMQLGKHVYVQKPLTYTIGEARLLTETARQHGVVTQMGNQGHSRDGTRRLCELIWSGAIGDVTEVHLWTNRPIWPQGIPAPTAAEPVPDGLDWDLWLGPAEKRPYHSAYLPFKWRGWRDFGCGALGDMACHIADPANWALRLSETGPTSVELLSQEGNNDDSFPTKSVIKYEFPKRGTMPPVTLFWHDGWKTPPFPEFLMGAVPGERDGLNGSIFIGTKGVATANTYGDNPRLLPEEKMDDFEWPEETIARVPRQNHYRDWINAIKEGRQAGSNFDYAGPFTEWVLLGNLATKFDRKLEWDAKAMRVTNVPEANEYIHRDYRAGWELGS